MACGESHHWPHKASGFSAASSLPGRGCWLFRVSVSRRCSPDWPAHDSPERTEAEAPPKRAWLPGSTLAVVSAGVQIRRTIRLLLGLLAVQTTEIHSFKRSTSIGRDEGMDFHAALCDVSRLKEWSEHHTAVPYRGSPRADRHRLPWLSSLSAGRICRTSGRAVMPCSAQDRSPSGIFVAFLYRLTGPTFGPGGWVNVGERFAHAPHVGAREEATCDAELAPECRVG